MRFTSGLCRSLCDLVVCCALGRFVGGPVVVTLTTATSPSAARALGLLSVLLTTGVICVDLGGLLLCVRSVVTLGLAVSAITAIVPVVSAAAVTLTIVVAVFAVVTLALTRSVTRSPPVLFTLATTVALTLF